MPPTIPDCSEQGPTSVDASTGSRSDLPFWTHAASGGMCSLGTHHIWVPMLLQCCSTPMPSEQRAPSTAWRPPQSRHLGQSSATDPSPGSAPVSTGWYCKGRMSTPPPLELLVTACVAICCDSFPSLHHPTCLVMQARIRDQSTVMSDQLETSSCEESYLESYRSAFELCIWSPFPGLQHNIFHRTARALLQRCNIYTMTPWQTGRRVLQSRPLCHQVLRSLRVNSSNHTDS
jgi:hypothetical protein